MSCYCLEVLCYYLEVIWYYLEAIRFRLKGDYVCIDSKRKRAYTLERTALPLGKRARTLERAALRDQARRTLECASLQQRGAPGSAGCGSYFIS